MDRLKEISKIRLAQINNNFERFLLNEIDFKNQMIGIKGARGTGKTTLLLQQMKRTPENESMYISLDDIFFTENKLVYFAEDFHRKGGNYLYLDEVHKYPNWSQELKNIYDNLPDLKIVFTSSSALDINRGKYDLSRRALVYELPGLSFREFLQLKYNIILPAYLLTEILENTSGIASFILKKIKPYQYFDEYLKAGYYPFFIENDKTYHIRLTGAVNIVIENELPYIYNIDFNSVVKLKKLVYLLASLVPYIPNISTLAKQTGTTRDSLLKYLQLLHNAHILKWLGRDAWGINFLNKPDKLFLENTNLAYALCDSLPEKGNLRESFFLNQLSVKHKVTYPEKGDFLIDGKYLFEVGGRNKTKKQIAGIENAYIAADDIEYGFENKIPLWLFGFLY